MTGVKISFLLDSKMKKVECKSEKRLKLKSDYAILRTVF